jgi:hypothetical protein
MKVPIRKVIIAGGMLNFLLALFHVFLCYRIYQGYGTTPVYPLLQMFSIGGTLMVVFLAYTSLFQAGDLATTSTGLTVIILNIFLYLARSLGEVLLFPKINFLIIGVCLFLVLLYTYVFIEVKLNVSAARRTT